MGNPSLLGRMASRLWWLRQADDRFRVAPIMVETMMMLVQPQPFWFGLTSISSRRPEPGLPALRIRQAANRLLLPKAWSYVSGFENHPSGSLAMDNTRLTGEVVCRRRLPALRIIRISPEITYLYPQRNRYPMPPAGPEVISREICFHWCRPDFHPRPLESRRAAMPEPQRHDHYSRARSVQRNVIPGPTPP